MATISVIIPLYNKGKYIARALDSVFTQTFEDFEVIVVDDGSADDGPDIVRKYDGPRLRLIQQANASPGSARNRGMRENKAPFIAFLNADDEFSILEGSCANMGRSRPVQSGRYNCRVNLGYCIFVGILHALLLMVDSYAG
jgi:glycosyltransferase involved in cell wall biosynthesis